MRRERERDARARRAPGRMRSCPASPTQKARANVQLDGVARPRRDSGRRTAARRSATMSSTPKLPATTFIAVDRALEAVRASGRRRARAATGSGSALMVRISPSTRPLSATTSTADGERVAGDVAARADGDVAAEADDRAFDRAGDVHRAAGDDGALDGGAGGDGARARR